MSSALSVFWGIANPNFADYDLPEARVLRLWLAFCRVFPMGFGLGWNRTTVLIGFMAATAQAQAEATKEAQKAGIAHAKAYEPDIYKGRKAELLKGTI
jgi:hypothetical protein